MLCKNCGTNIEEKSKFCGYCGSKIEVENNLQSEIINIFENETNVLNNKVNLDNTIRIEPVENDFNITEVSSNNESIIQTPTTNQVVNQNIITQDENINVLQNNIKNKKKNKLLFAICSAFLLIVTIVVVVMIFLKSPNNLVSVLEKAIYNLGAKSDGNLTIDASLSFTNTEGATSAFSLTVKTEMKDEVSGKIQMTLNESLAFDEMNIYSSINKNEVTLYAESNVVDKLTFTSSPTQNWLYYIIPFDEIIEEHNESNHEDVKLQDLIDKEHFKYIDEENGLKHYILIVDQKLIDDLKEKLENIKDEDIKNMLYSMERLAKTIQIDFYINSSDVLSKIEINMTEHLTEISENISELVLTITFRDLNNTKVEIPAEALSSKINLETYISENSINSDIMLEDSNDNLDLKYNVG